MRLAIAGFTELAYSIKNIYKILFYKRHALLFISNIINCIKLSILLKFFHFCILAEIKLSSTVNYSSIQIYNYSNYSNIFILKVYYKVYYCQVYFFFCFSLYDYVYCRTF